MGEITLLVKNVGRDDSILGRMSRALMGQVTVVRGNPGQDHSSMSQEPIFL